MRRARLRRSGCRAVLPWKALALRGAGVTRDVLASGSDSNNYAFSTNATRCGYYARSNKLARLRFGLASVSSALAFYGRYRVVSLLFQQASKRGESIVASITRPRDSSYFLASLRGC